MLSAIRLRRDVLNRSVRLLSAFVAFSALTVFSVNVSALAQDVTAPTPKGAGTKLPATGQAAEVVSFFSRKGPAQPVEWKLPKGAVAAVAQHGAFVSDESDSNVFGLEVGRVYRFRIDRFENRPGDAVYPTVELIGRLNPPAGKRWEFPIELAIPQADIDDALNGAFVTRVVFLENSENPANVDTSENPENLTLDVPQGVDPIIAARTRGRALAVVRIGTRAPSSEPNADDPFFFGLPKVEFKPVDLVDKSKTQDLSDEDAKAAADPANVK